MIKRELFKNYKWKAVAVAALIGVSATFGGCATQTNAPVSTTIQEVETETPATLSVVSESETASDMSLPEGVKVADIVSPTLVVGNEKVEVMEGEGLEGLDMLNGVSATDDEDGDLTSSIGVSAFDAALFDEEQTITYTVSDKAGNEATATSTLTIKSDSITVMDKKMYAVSAVNVRSGANKDTEKVGSLSYSEPIKVTGQDIHTKWYQIIIVLADGTNGVGYVSDKFLSDTKPEPQVASKPKDDTSTTKSNDNTSGESTNASPENSDTTAGGAKRITREEMSAWREARGPSVDTTPDRTFSR